MFQLLQPIWLFAISGIAIPIIIHLWNNRKGKTLKVGSILLVQESATQQARSFRLTQLFLLMLRCLLIIILSLLIAQPVWKTNLTSVNEKGWLLIEKQKVQEAYKNFKPTIDSLISSGYKFHYFNIGFKPDKLENALKVIDNGPDQELSYWTLLQELNEQVPAELPVYLFTNNQLKRFHGTRPEISMNLNWSTYTSGDTMANKLASAYKTSADSLRIISVNSKPTATVYYYENITGNGNNKYKLMHSDGKIFISSISDTAKLEIDTSKLNITIYTDQFTNDANYLKAAFEAIRQYTQRTINITNIGNVADIKPGTNWLFWLSEKPLPAQPLPARIFIYEKGKEQLTNSWIATRDNLAVNNEPISLSRTIRKASSANGFQTVWKDGFGNTLLGLERTENLIYHFYSRFNPEWNNLAWSPQFVEMIFDLLIQPNIDIKNFDKRIIDAEQLQPQHAQVSKAFDKEKFVEITDLARVFWLIAFIIFSIERYLSLNTKKQ